VEQEAREAGAVTRNQNVVYAMPHDWASIAQFLAPLLERIDESSQDIQVLVITPDADVAAAVSASAVKLLEGRNVQTLAATSPARAARLARIKPPHLIAASPATLVELMCIAAIKLDTVRSICLAWADEIIARDGSAALETVMAEVPKDAARVIVAADVSAEVEALVERYARRARRIPPSTAEGKPTAIEYVTVSSHARLNALRRVLDALDPKSATVFVRDRDRIADVNDLLRSIGSDANVRVAMAAAPGDDAVILFDLPASREELNEAAGAAGRAVALVQPRQLTSLRALAAGGAIKPYTLPESGKTARDFDARIRSELRLILDEGRFGRALLAVEPLLDDFDGSEIAAAALVLLERERDAMRAALAAVPATQRGGGEMVRLFVTVGSRDGLRPGDLVGAMANEGGVASSEFGKVDIRESHSTIEVSPSVADTLIEKLNGANIKGRRAVVRRDEHAGRGERPGGRGDRPDRGARGPRSDRGDRGDRGPSRGGPRGERRGERTERTERTERGDRERRPRREDRE
jgi:ATP-dependent RNA helicase DeaD